MNQTHPRTVKSRLLHSAWKSSILPFMLFLTLPILALILRIHPADLLTSLGQKEVSQALALSVKTSLFSVLATVLLGTPVAYYLSHRHYRFYHLVDTLTDLPLVLPPAVAGVALLVAFGRRGLLGPTLAVFGITIPFTQLAVVMAQTFVAAPLFIKAAALGFSAVDCELKRAAALDGASRWQIFRYVEAPLSGSAILSGLVMSWARALGEFGATIIFAGNYPGRTQTIPLAIYLGFELDMNVALTLSVILVAFSFLILFIVKVILHQRVEIPIDQGFE